MATIDKIDKSKLSGKTLDFYEKLEKQYKSDKDLGEKIAKQFYDRLVSNNHPSVAKKKAQAKKITKAKAPVKKAPAKKVAPKKAPAKKAAPKKVATKTTTKRGKSGWQKEVKKIQADLGITYKEATRVYKARRKDTKGKSESISALISRFKKDFGAVKPNKTRNLDQDSKIPAKTAVKRKSPTYGKKGGAKQEYYYEYRMNRRDNSKKPAYLEKGGKIDFSKRTSDDFKLGELVYDTSNKRYGTIIGKYDGKNDYFDKYEVRLDSDGMQPTENLRKLNESGDNGTKKQLFEAVASMDRLTKMYPDSNYPKIINNPFYAKGGQIDIDYSGSDKDFKELIKKYDLEISKMDKGMAIIKGDKDKLLKFLKSDNYGMENDDIKYLYPELFAKGGVTNKTGKFVIVNKYDDDVINVYGTYPNKKKADQDVKKMQQESDWNPYKQDSESIEMDKKKYAKGGSIESVSGNWNPKQLKNLSKIAKKLKAKEWYDYASGGGFEHLMILLPNNLVVEFSNGDQISISMTTVKNLDEAYDLGSEEYAFMGRYPDISVEDDFSNVDQIVKAINDEKTWQLSFRKEEYPKDYKYAKGGETHGMDCGCVDCYAKGGEIDFYDADDEINWNNSSLEERKKLLSKTTFSDKYINYDYRNLSPSIKEKLKFAQGGKLAKSSGDYLFFKEKGGEIDVRDEGNMAKTYDGRIGKISKVDGLYYTLKFKDGKLPYKLTLHQKDIIFSDSKFFAKGGELKSKESDLKEYIKEIEKEHNIDIEYGGYEEYDGENLFFVHYEIPEEKLVENKLNEWVKKSKLKNIEIYEATDNFSDYYGGFWTMIVSQWDDDKMMAKGGKIQNELNELAKKLKQKQNNRIKRKPYPDMDYKNLWWEWYGIPKTDRKKLALLLGASESTATDVAQTQDWGDMSSSKFTGIAGKIKDFLIKNDIFRKEKSFGKGGEIEKYYATAKKLKAKNLSKLYEESDELVGKSFTFKDMDNELVQVYYDKDQDGIAINQDGEIDDISISQMSNMISDKMAKGGRVFTEKEMQDIIASGTISNYNKKEQRQIFVYAFGEDFMDEDDELKGRRRKYDKAGNRVTDPDRDFMAKGGEIKDYNIALGTIVMQVGKNPKLDKYKTKSGIKVGEIKDLGKTEVIKLANSLNSSMEKGGKIGYRE